MNIGQVNVGVVLCGICPYFYMVRFDFVNIGDQAGGLIFDHHRRLLQRHIVANDRHEGRFEGPIHAVLLYMDLPYVWKVVRDSVHSARKLT